MKDEPRPGDWIIENEPFNIWERETGQLVARFNAPFKPDALWEHGCRNTRLAAAAPDMLAALRRLSDALERIGLDSLTKEDHEAWLEAEKAIAKAIKSRD